MRLCSSLRLQVNHRISRKILRLSALGYKAAVGDRRRGTNMPPRKGPNGGDSHHRAAITGPAALHGTPRTVAPSPESIPYITVPSMLASQPGDEYAFASPDAYNTWRQSPQVLPPPASPHVNPAFVPNGPRPTRVDHWHAGLDPLPRPPLANGIRAGQASAGPSTLPGAALTNGYGLNQVRPLHTTPGVAAGREYPAFAKTTTVQTLSDISANELAPPRSVSSYKSPHLRPGRSSKSKSPTPDFAGQRYPGERPPPPVALPHEDYLELSRPSQHRSGPRVKPKVLVMDLNGAIIYRTDASASNRKSYPRPYLSCLLDYLFLPEPIDTAFTDPLIRPWSVFVWSSAQPHNVRAMVEMGFGPKYIQGVWQEESKKSMQARAKSGEGRLLGVWARDKMGLNQSDYRNKVQTFKDLSRVAEHLSIESVASEDVTQYQFDLENTVLLDDSPMKARFQPWNQLVIPEYGKTEFASSRTAAGRTQASTDTDTQPEGMDCILLAIIGMLEEMRKLGNVPAWIRGGGLTRLPKVNQDSEDEESVDESLIEDSQPTLEDMPSHEHFKHWYEDPKVAEYWIDRGKKALARKGIAIVHGIDAHGRSPSQDPEGGPVQAAQTNADLRQRRWSPSRPVSPSYDRTATPNGTTPQPSNTTTRAVSPSGSAFGRRGFATMSEALPEAGPSVPPMIQVSEATPTTSGFHVPYAAPTLPGPSAPGLPMIRPAGAPPNWQGPRDQRWRTFTALEVSQYLIDIADRATSTSQGEAIDTTTLKAAAEILKRHNDNVEPRRQGPTGPWKGDLCVKCLKYLGGLEGGINSQIRRQQALDAGFSATASLAWTPDNGIPEDPEAKARKAEKRELKKARKADARVEKQMAKKTAGGTKGKKKAAALSNAAKKERKAIKGKAKAAADPTGARKKAKSVKAAKFREKQTGRTQQAEQVESGHAEVVEASQEKGKAKAKAAESEGNDQAGNADIVPSAELKKKKSGPTVATSNDTTKEPDNPNANVGPSTPRRTLRPVDSTDLEPVSPRRSNPRRSATNVDAIRAEAQLEAEIRQQTRTSPKRVKSEVGSPTTRKVKIEL